MKLSNKILIGFFGFIFLYLSAAFAEIRFRGNPNRFLEAAISEKVDLSEINYLIINDLGKSIKVIGSNKSQIEVKSVEGNNLVFLNYLVSGDTLTLIKLDSIGNKLIPISIQVPKNSFRGITIQGAGVSVESLKQNQLSIIQNNGWINIRDSKFEKMVVWANNTAQLTLSNSELDSLTAFIDHSEARFNIPVSHISGEMTNNSYLRVNGTQEIQLKTDTQSRLDLN